MWWWSCHSLFYAGPRKSPWGSFREQGTEKSGTGTVDGDGELLKVNRGPVDIYVIDTPLTANEVLRLFHRDEPFLFLGAAFTTVALLCAAFSLLRRKFDALLLWLAAFAFLYGQRLWLDTNILGVTLQGKELFNQIRWIVSFLTPVPAFFFFQSAGLIPRRGRPFMFVLVFLFLGLAIMTLIVGRLPVLHTINNLLVIAALPWLLLRTYLQGRVSRDFVVMRWGLLCFVVLALWDNTIGDLRRWREH